VAAISADDVWAVGDYAAGQSFRTLTMHWNGLRWHRASRQRIVAAQDQERRKLERNIHDGAQQQLVALAVKLNLAGSLVSKDSAHTSRPV